MEKKNTFEVVLSNGDRAEADSPEGIILAARTLCQDIRDTGVWGPKPTATFLANGRCVLADVTSYRIRHGAVV